MSVQLTNQERAILAPFITGYEVVHGKIQGSIFESNIAGELFDDIVRMHDVYQRMGELRDATLAQKAIDILMKHIQFYHPSTVTMLCLGSLPSWGITHNSVSYSLCRNLVAVNSMFIFDTEAEAINHAENFLLGNNEFTGYVITDCIYGWTYTVTREESESIDFDDIPF